MRISTISIASPQCKAQIGKQQIFEGSAVPFSITYKVKELKNPDRTEVVSPYQLKIKDNFDEPTKHINSKDQIDPVMQDLIKKSRYYTGTLGDALMNYPSKVIKGTNAYKEITSPVPDQDGFVSKTKIGSIYYMNDVFEEVDYTKYNYIVRQGWTYKPLGNEEIEITDGYY
jgi:hypothetical protein